MMTFVKNVLKLLGATWGIFFLAGMVLNIVGMTITWELLGIILAIIDCRMVIKYLLNEDDYCEEHDISKNIAYLVFLLIWILGNGLMFLIAPLIGMMMVGDPGHALVAVVNVIIGVLPVITFVIAKAVIMIKKSMGI